MKIAVTSASGQLGAAIARQLVQDMGRDNVLAIARTPENAAHLGLEVRKGDYDNRQDFELALQGVDAVLLVSGMAAPQDRIQQHRNVIEAAQSCGVKKIVYTSIVGDASRTTFSPIIQSNRQTEADIRQSGLDWAIGRNGLYIEPDLEYVDKYVEKGKIWNCAGAGLCAYTSRKELAVAYSNMLQEERHKGHTYNLVGEPIRQQQLADYINQVFKTQLIYESMGVEAYLEDRKAELGEFLGTVIAGIYEGIRNGDFAPASDFEKATGRSHISALEIIRDFKSPK